MSNLNAFLEKIVNGLKFKRIELILFSAACLIRWVWLLVVISSEGSGIWTPDSYGYWNIAKNLLQYGAFSQSPDGINLEPDFYRTPIYPLYLLVIQFFTQASEFAVALQILMAGLTSVFIYRIGKDFLNSPMVGLLASIIFLFDIPSIIFSTLILTETLFTMLLVISCYWMLQFLLEGFEVRSLLKYAVVTGILILCRPAGLFLPIMFTVLILVRTKSLKQVMIPVGTVVLTVLLVMMPWLSRNKIAFDSYFLSTIGKYVLYNYHASGIHAVNRNIPFHEAQMEMRMKLYENNCKDIDPVKCSGYAFAQAVDTIKNYPGTFVLQQLKNSAFILLKPVRGYVDGQLGYSRGYNSVTTGSGGKLYKISDQFADKTSLPTKVLVGLQLFIQVIIIICSLLGFLLLYRKRNFLILLFLILIILYFMNMTVPPESDARLRVPVVPFFALAGAIGIVSVLRNYRKSGELNKN